MRETNDERDEQLRVVYVMQIFVGLEACVKLFCNDIICNIVNYILVRFFCERNYLQYCKFIYNGFAQM